MSVVIELDSWRKTPTSFKSLSHPAGVVLPFEGQPDAELIIPEIRSRIVSGEYGADLLQQLSTCVKPVDRVLVVGAGLGAASTLVAKTKGVRRVIAVEANLEMIPYLKRTHELNGVPWIECVNAVLCSGWRGRVPFYARPDIRASSLLPDECSWQLEMLVPCMDTNLILSEERISLIVCEIPAGVANLLASADLSLVDRILVGGSDGALATREQAEVLSVLAEKGYEVEKSGSAMLFDRARARGEGFLSATDRA